MHVHFTKDLRGLLGVNLMIVHDVVFDVEKSRVGFAESDYNYNRRTEENDERG